MDCSSTARVMPERISSVASAAQWSASLGRVLSSEVSVDGKKPIPGGAFPLFPQSRRSLDIRWSDDATPEKLVLRFANFTVEERRKAAN